MPTLFQNVNVNTIDGVKQLLNNAALILMWFVGALAVIFIIVGGIQYITSAGNPSGQEKSKKTITYAIGGLILALSTAAIISFIGTVFKI
jgi:surface polysaccharide O-acyltransferase-like enzyme